jgi:hypothetical protein
MSAFVVLLNIIFGLIGTTIAQHFFGAGLGFAVGWFLVGTPIGWFAAKWRERS